MKRLLIIFILMHSISLLNAQILFNKNHLTDIDSFAVLPAGYLGYSWGMTFDDVDKDTIKLIGNGPSGNTDSKIYIYNIINDSSFVLLNRIDGTIINHGLTVIVNGLNRINDSIYTLACIYNHYNANNIVDTLKSGLIFFNNQGDTLYSRWFGENKRFIIRGFERIDNHLFLLGTTKIIGDGTKAYIVKTDLQGNLIWEKMLTQYTIFYNNVIHIAKTGTDGYLLTGVHNSNANGNNGGLYKIDSNGNIVWHKNLYKNANNGCFNIREDTTDGNYFLSGNRDTIVNADDYPNNGFISKIDSMGNFIWIKVFNEHPKILKNIWQYRILKNGDLIFCGERFENLGSNVHVGWICKTDKEGNIKWENTYKFNDSSSYNILSEIKQMPDGGFIATGICRDSITKYYGIWLLRVDSNGCLIPGCFPTAVQVYPDEQMQINVYPNPTQGNFTIAYSKALPTKSSIKIMDITGRTIHTQQEQQGAYKTSVTLQQSVGIYFLQIINDKGQQIFKQKILLE